MFERRCLALHSGPWLIEPKWMTSAFQCARERGFQEAGKPYRHDDDDEDEHDDDPDVVYLSASMDGSDDSVGAPKIAVIPLVGPMMKGDSKFGGANSVRIRKAVRAATDDPSISHILMHIDSPGGTVAGTEELARDVRRAATTKPTHAFIDDLGASAAYWIASQTSRITANKTAEVGSIGTVAIVEDVSGAMEAEGIKVHVVSTGAYKGAFAFGSPVTEDHLQYLKSLVDGLNTHFLGAVKFGRKGRMTSAQLNDASDGRVHLAADAQSLGLIDAIGSIDEAAAALRRTKTVAKSATQQRIALTKLRTRLL